MPKLGPGDRTYYWLVPRARFYPLSKVRAHNKFCDVATNCTSELWLVYNILLASKYAKQASPSIFNCLHAAKWLAQ